MSFIHLPQITGCATSAALLYDICRRMPWGGGAEHDGHHWVWISAQEASKVVNCARNTAARHLRLLVEAGFLVREKLGVITNYGRNRTWYYRPGPRCPSWLLGNAKTNDCAVHCATAAQSTKNPTSSPDNKNQATSGKKQPGDKPEPRMNIPDADQTASILEGIRAWPEPQPPAIDTRDAILNRRQRPLAQTAFGNAERFSSLAAVPPRQKGPIHAQSAPDCHGTR